MSPAAPSDIYRFDKVSVSIGGAQSLVQSVTVKGGAGLENIILPESSSPVIVRKAANIEISIQYLDNGEFVSPLSCSYCNNFGSITIGRSGGSGLSFGNCILIGTESEIDAKNVFGSKTITYLAMSVSVEGGFSVPSAKSRNGNGTGAERACYTNILTNNQTGYRSSCRIPRQFIYSPGNAAPTHLCIQYPIVTTSSVITPSSLRSISLIDCDSVPEGGNSGIPDGVLEGISLEGGSAGSSDYQYASFNYTSNHDYGLTRILQIS